MKWNNKWIAGISFLAGVLICYISLQIRFFDVKLELDIPNLILSILTLFVGIYIADTLQKRINKDQNKHSYLINKLDILWQEFNTFSEILSFNSKIEAHAIQEFAKKNVYPISFLKNVFTSFEIDKTCICTLEINLENLEKLLSNIPASDNIVDYENEIPQINSQVLIINQCFSQVLKDIQGL